MKRAFTMVELMIGVAILGIIAAVAIPTITGGSGMSCSGSGTADQVESIAVDRQQSHFAVTQPVPFLEHSPEREYVRDLIKLRQENVSTHSVWISYGTYLDDCPSMGFGIPYDVQLTNPLQVERDYSAVQGLATGVVEQAEPNGLFSSKNTAATWVLCVEEDGSLAPVYVEATVNVYPWRVEVDYEANVLYRVGKSNVRMNKAKAK